MGFRLRNVRFLAILAFWILLIGCDNPDSPKPPLEFGFFDLDNYFLQESEKVIGYAAEKRVKINGESEKKSVSGAELKEDLKLFGSYDLNRKSWGDKYVKDTLYSEDGNVRELRYSSPDLRVRSMTIRFDGDEVSEILVKAEAKNILYSSTQSLTYRPESGYHMEKFQKVISFSRKNYSVDVEWDKG